MGDLSRTVSESLGDFLQKWGIPAIPRPRINTGHIAQENLLTVIILVLLCVSIPSAFSHTAETNYHKNKVISLPISGNQPFFSFSVFSAQNESNQVFLHFIFCGSRCSCPFVSIEKNVPNSDKSAINKALVSRVPDHARSCVNRI